MDIAVWLSGLTALAGVWLGGLLVAWLLRLPELRKVAAQIRAWEAAGYQESLYGIECDLAGRRSYSSSDPYTFRHSDPQKVDFYYGYWPQLAAKAVARSRNSQYRRVTLIRQEGDGYLKWSWAAGRPVGTHPDPTDGDTERAKKRWRPVRAKAALRRWNRDPRTQTRRNRYLRHENE